MFRCESSGNGAIRTNRPEPRIAVTKAIGGGIASLRHDPQGKALAQNLRDLPVRVPSGWRAPGGRLADWPEEAKP